MPIEVAPEVCEKHGLTDCISVLLQHFLFLCDPNHTFHFDPFSILRLRGFRDSLLTTQHVFDMIPRCIFEISLGSPSPSLRRTNPFISALAMLCFKSNGGACVSVRSPTYPLHLFASSQGSLNLSSLLLSRSLSGCLQPSFTETIEGVPSL